MRLYLDTPASPDIVAKALRRAKIAHKPLVVLPTAHGSIIELFEELTGVPEPSHRLGEGQGLRST